MVLTASNAKIDYTYENSHGMVHPMGSTNTANYGLFGPNQRISALNFSNSMIDLPQIGTPEIQEYAFGTDRGSCSIDYTLANPWPFSSVLGTITLPGSGSDQQWTSNPGTTNAATTPLTMNVQFGYKNESGSSPGGTVADVVRRAQGVVTSSLAIRTSIDSTVDVTQSMLWGREEGITPPVANEFSVITSSNDRTFTRLGVDRDIDRFNDGFTPYTFAHSSIYLKDDNAAPGVNATDFVGQIQDFDLTLDTGAEQLYQIGEAHSVDAFRKILRITGKINVAVSDADNFERVVRRPASGREPRMRIRFSNNKGDDLARTIDITLGRVAFSEHSTGFEPGEPIYEDLSFQAGTITVNATNGTAENRLPHNITS